MKPVHLLRWGGLALFLVTLVGAVVSAAFEALGVLSYLQSLGWGEYLGMNHSLTTFFAFECYNDNACRRVFLENVHANGLSVRTLLLLAVSAVSLITSAMASLMQGDPKAKDPGGSKFSTDDDLASYLKDDKKDPENRRVAYLGCTESGRQIQPRIRDRCTHVGLYAGTGGGKTSRIIKPSIVADAQAGVSVLMVDPKWPDPEGGYSDLLSVFEGHDYDVQVFCPFNEHTMHLPLIGSIQNDQDAANLAALIIPRTDGNEQSEGSTFYKDVERRLLMYLLQGAALEKNHSVASIYKRLDGGPDALERWANTCPDADLKNSVKNLLKLRGDTLIGLIQGLMSKLQIFTDPNLDRATQASPQAWKNLNALALTQKKSALYVGIPNYVLLRGEGKILLSLFFRNIMNDLMMFAEESGGTLPRHIAVYLDEFAHIGRIDDASLWFGTMRSYKIGFMVAMQNRAQLELVYGTIGAKALSGGNFQHLITFPNSLMLDDKKYISELLGEVTVAEFTEGRSQQHIFELPRKTRMKKLVSRPLVSVEEMNSWPEDVGILAPHGTGPTRIIAPRIDQRAVGRVKNPFYAYGKLLGQGDSKRLVQTVLNRRRFRWISEPLGADLRIKNPKQTTDPVLDPGYTLLEEPGVTAAEPNPAPAAVVASPPPSPLPDQPTFFADDAKPKATPPKPRAKTKGTAKPANTPQQRPAKTTPPLPNIPQGELMQAFRAWIAGLRWKRVPVTVYTVRTNGQDRVSKVLFERNPGALRHEYLDTWKRRKWVQVRHGRFGIIGTGTNVLCKNQLQAFMDAANSTVIDVGHDNERVVVKERTKATETLTTASVLLASEHVRQPSEEDPSFQSSVAESTPTAILEPHAKEALLGWYAKNRFACAYDPLYEHIRLNVEASPYKGIIQPAHFLLPRTQMKTLIGKAANALRAKPLANNAGNRTEFVEVPAQLALRLEPLQHWLTKNREKFEPYKSDETPVLNDDTAGFYQPTLLSVIRHVLQDELPHVPVNSESGAELWDRPRIHNQRHRLLRYAVRDAFTK